MKWRARRFALAGMIAAGAWSLPAAESPPKPRGLWFWSKAGSPYGSVNVVGDPAREAEALATLARWNIRRLYGSYGALPMEAPARIAAWNRRLRLAGIRSDALFSDSGALSGSGRERFLRDVEERVLAFNAARADPRERFDGIALDVEPHALPVWKTTTGEGRRALLEELLAMCGALRERLDARGGRELSLSAALPYWLDRLPPEGRVTWRSAADRDDWFARLGKCVPAISLMAYERSAPAAILDAVAWERAHFSGTAITALRARLGVEWQTLSDLARVLPEVEAASPLGIDLENYELLRRAEQPARSD